MMGLSVRRDNPLMLTQDLPDRAGRARQSLTLLGRRRLLL